MTEKNEPPEDRVVNGAAFRNGGSGQAGPPARGPQAPTGPGMQVGSPVAPGPRPVPAPLPSAPVPPALVPPPPPEAARRRARARPSLPGEVHDRLTIFVVRALFFFIAGGIGLYCAAQFQTDRFLSIISACVISMVVILGEVFFSKTPVRTIAAITFGLIMGIALSAILQPMVELIVQALAPPSFRDVDREKLLQFLRIVDTTVFCYFGVTILLQTKDDFKFIIPFVEFRREVKGRAPLVLDTSAIIDGRIHAFLATGVLDQRIAVPKFVFDELQAIADSSDRSKRERGRRGMDILDRICREYGAEILDRSRPPGTDVDAALLELVTFNGGRLVTTDYNLQKRARLQDITVINLNDLAQALKPVVVPGEGLRVRLLRPGEDQGQAVGFLDDGTMVVVENAGRRIGQEVAIEVTSAIQTSAGKMVFGRLRQPPADQGPREERGFRGPRGPESHPRREGGGR